MGDSGTGFKFVRFAIGTRIWTPTGVGKKKKDIVRYSGGPRIVEEFSEVESGRFA